MHNSTNAEKRSEKPTALISPPCPPLEKEAALGGFCADALMGSQCEGRGIAGLNETIGDIATNI